jgi:hypothetical protein
VPPKRKADSIAQLNLRLPESLRRRIEVAAKKNHHSLNVEIISRLEASLQLEGHTDLMRDAMVRLAEHVGLPELAQQVRGNTKKENEGNG